MKSMRKNKLEIVSAHNTFMIAFYHLNTKWNHCMAHAAVAAEKQKQMKKLQIERTKKRGNKKKYARATANVNYH